MTAFDADLRSLAAQTSLSRRTVVATSLATGFAMAVQPIAAQTAIITDTNGLTAGEVKIPTQDGEIPAYRAMPANDGPFPTVLVVQEIFGVHEHIKDVCRRLAKLGYFAVAPELYARQGDVSKLTNIQQIVSEVVSKVPDAQVMADLDATVAFAKATGKADVTRLGITGFCWGGRIVWLYAAHNAALKAGVAWYGRLVGDTSTLMPKNPVDLAADLKAPVLGLYGGADQGIPISTIDQMKEACRAAGKTCEFVVYPGAPHAFHADYRPSYRAEPAHDGWQRLQAWFRQHGVA
ncbi:dienelactone hydrolase family protein [Methylobacterium durans]|uniref:Carboxymethylenebutenolidase n=1 Tax=Methylobacterium durans TaxID=2202825 RepID=A0A2U8WES7_9HYPH|nr:dienelactone hydrolase family protein [Methylobacterium durans]AWN44061.1 carboxymethylenebutenolidase [Methylobacterium durans]